MLAIVLAALLIDGPNKDPERIDPLAALAQEGALEIEPRFGRMCNSQGLSSLHGVDAAQPQETAAIRDLAEIAVHQLELPVCESSVQYIPQEWWPDTFVFRITCCSGFGIMQQIVAVTTDQNVIRLGHAGERSAENFNRLALQHEVRIEDPMGAEWYAQFAFAVYFPDTPAYLPSSSVAEVVLEEPFDWPSILVDAFRQVTRAAVSIEVDGAAFRGTTFVWWWWYGAVERATVKIQRNGTVAIDIDRVGDQRGLAK